MGEPQEVTEAKTFHGVPTHFDQQMTDFPVAVAAAKFIGHLCSQEELDFLECKGIDKNPRACIPENLAFTECSSKAMDALSRQCAWEFDELVDCLDEPTNYFRLDNCRVHEKELRVCVKARFGFDMNKEERKRRNASIMTWATLRNRPKPVIITEDEEEALDYAVQAYKKRHNIQ